MSESLGVTRRVALIALGYAFAHVIVPVSVFVVVFVPSAVSPWPVLAVTVAATALLYRLLTPLARALVVVESMALDGLDPVATRIVKGSLWGRWGIASSVVGLTRSLIISGVLGALAGAAAIGLNGDVRLALGLVAVVLALFMPTGFMWLLRGSGEAPSVASAISAGARGDEAALRQASELLREHARVEMWPDSPV